jgi:hypothetical protein
VSAIAHAPIRISFFMYSSLCSWLSKEGLPGFSRVQTRNA